MGIVGGWVGMVGGEVGRMLTIVPVGFRYLDC